MICRLVLCIN